MPNMFSGIGEMRVSCSWAGLGNAEFAEFLTITIYLPSIIIDDAEEGQEASESYHVAEYLGLQHLPEPSSFAYFWRTNEE